MLFSSLIQIIAWICSLWPYKQSEPLEEFILTDQDYKKISKISPEWKIVIDRYIRTRPYVAEGGETKCERYISLRTSDFSARGVRKLYNRRLLPHGWIFQLVTGAEIQHNEEGHVGFFTGAIPYLLCLGHFFGNPISPGQIIGEFIGQCFGLIFLTSADIREKVSKKRRSVVELLQVSNCTHGFSITRPREEIHSCILFLSLDGKRLVAAPTAYGITFRVTSDGRHEVISTTSVAGAAKINGKSTGYCFSPKEQDAD